MARDYARVKLAIWDDDDFRGLPVPAQHLYFVLLTSPALTYCGVTDWRPARLSGFADGWSSQDVEVAAYTLAERSYVVIDERTEEVLIRSFIRHDGLMEKPRMAVSMVNAHRSTASPILRGVVVHELQRLHTENPDLNGWKDVHGKPGLALDLTKREGVDPAELASDLKAVCPSVCEAFASNASLGLPSVCPPPTPAPTPAPYSHTPRTESEAADATPARRTDVERLCNLLADHIEANGGKRPSITKGWRDAARLLMDRDGRTEQQVAWMIDWCQRDEFWHTNILSMPKLREKFDQLVMKARPAQQQPTGLRLAANGEPIIPMAADDRR